MAVLLILQEYLFFVKMHFPPPPGQLFISTRCCLLHVLLKYQEKNTQIYQVSIDIVNQFMKVYHMIVIFVSQQSDRNTICQHTSNQFISKKPINVKYVFIKQHKRVTYPDMSQMFIKRVKILSVVNVTNLFKRYI